MSVLALETMSEAVGEFLTRLWRRVARDVLVELAPGVLSSKEVAKAKRQARKGGGKGLKAGGGGGGGGEGGGGEGEGGGGGEGRGSLRGD